jgi:endonuclease/exonuclease/phosphatase family metal-dependent hydrolase
VTRGGRIASRLTGAVAGVLALLAAAVWLTTFHPPPLQEEPVTCEGAAPSLAPGQRLKVLSWNVQFMAGKDHVFFFDLLDGSGPDERPAPADVARTLGEVARVLRDEAPDVVLLQEVDHGAARTDHADQLRLLLARLPGGAFPCRAASFYWKAAYVPHPRIHGAVGMTLAVLSRYRISSALRHQLATMPHDVLTRQFDLKRAVLEVRLPVEGGGEVAVLDTHLDAFAQGHDTMERQVRQVDAIVGGLSARGIPWVIGGDFNLLPPGGAYARLAPDQRAYFNPETEAALLFARHQAVPSLEETGGVARESWFTHFPNDPAVRAPDRTIDYLFLDRRLRLGEHHVRSADARAISDHFPVVAEVRLP